MWRRQTPGKLDRELLAVWFVLPMAKTPTTGICRLCLQQGVLVDSHIVPNFLCKPMRQKEKFYLAISTDPEVDTSKKQKFITEYLLCPKCDNERLSECENHFRKVFFGGYPIGGKVSGIFHTFTGFDYVLLKNALLSILWRMSLSTHRFYRQVSLGQKHEERLRQILLNRQKTDPLEYSIHLSVPVLEGIVGPDISVGPDSVRQDNNRVYRCLISGLLFSFMVGSAPVTKGYAPEALNETELVAVILDVENIPFLKAAFIEVAKAEAERAKASA